jgi:hypothetical protein
MGVLVLIGSFLILAVLAVSVVAVSSAVLFGCLWVQWRALLMLRTEGPDGNLRRGL